MPFWDECSTDSLTNGIPWALTDKSFTFANGETIPNPLRSYRFPRNIVDHLAENELVTGNLMIYSKPAGYETVRYPYSGLVGSLKDSQETAKHNAKWSYPKAVEVLNENIKAWLNQTIVINKRKISTGVHNAFVACLKAPNYTVFSNTTSAAAWGDNNPPEVALESPHNKIHLAVGGYDVPASSAPDQPDLSVIRGANGDMGENDTAGLDPIFFFHHCFIDRVFWLWQQANDATDDLPIIAHYPGTNSADSQGATPGIPANEWLTMDTPLEPFTRTDNGSSRPYVGRDGFNIETQLGYRYGPGSLEPGSVEARGCRRPEGLVGFRRRAEAARRGDRSQPHPRLLPDLRLRRGPREASAPRLRGGLESLARRGLRQLPDASAGRRELPPARARGQPARRERAPGRGPHAPWAARRPAAWPGGGVRRDATAFPPRGALALASPASGTPRLAGRGPHHIENPRNCGGFP